ncbi:MAG TPA: hypothetical protein VNM48_20805 [Chloroflexota bacterium]|nr:hypothetical protein [Chloroflexota bacterium]
MVFKWIGNLIDGKPKEGALPASTPPPVAEPAVEESEDLGDESGLVNFEPDGSINLHAKNVEQAKLALKELKLRKKELAIMKKEAAAEAREIRAAATDKNLRRGPAMRGGGSFGRFLRGMDASGRAGDRQTLAKNLAPHEAQRARIDQMLLAVDKAVIQVETYIVKNS